MIATIYIFAQTPTQGQPELLSTLLPFLFMGVIFYFMLIRPQQKKQKQHQQLLASLKSGDKVVTNGGIHGLISNVKDSTILLRVAENVKIEIDKSAIAGIERSSEVKPASAETKPIS